MIKKILIGKDLKENGCSIIEVLSRPSIGGTEKTMEELSHDRGCPGRNSNRALQE
jgi:hypothetical protein